MESAINAIPAYISVSARYSGFRLKRNGPSVTSFATGLSGLMVVPASRKVRIPQIGPSHTPPARIMPPSVQARAEGRK